MKANRRPPAVHRAIGQLQRLTELFGKRRVQLATGVGLTEQQWRVLEEIATEHFMPSMFARGRRSTAAAVSRIIRQLLDKQLVSVSVSRTDGRQRRYVLTAKGSARSTRCAPSAGVPSTPCGWISTRRRSTPSSARAAS